MNHNSVLKLNTQKHAFSNSLCNGAHFAQMQTQVCLDANILTATR